MKNERIGWHRNDPGRAWNATLDSLKMTPYDESPEAEARRAEGDRKIAERERIRAEWAEAERRGELL